MKNKITKEENIDLLNKRLNEINVKTPTLIAFDFDELVVPIHLTRKITSVVSKQVDQVKLKELGSCSFEGIKYLNSLMIGLDYEEYKKIRDKIAKETPWRDDFDKLILELKRYYTIIFISSGLKDICYSKLKEINFEENHIFGDELNVEKGKITSSNLIISDELKGEIIKFFKKKRKIIAIGHSLGDKKMLDSADISISYCANIPNLAKYNVSTTKEISDIIKINKDM